MIIIHKEMNFRASDKKADYFDESAGRVITKTDSFQLSARRIDL
jgi:hypothetical protein